MSSPIPLQLDHTEMSASLKRMVAVDIRRQDLAARDDLEPNFEVRHRLNSHSAHDASDSSSDSNSAPDIRFAAANKSPEAACTRSPSASPQTDVNRLQHQLTSLVKELKDLKRLESVPASSAYVAKAAANCAAPEPDDRACSVDAASGASACSEIAQTGCALVGEGEEADADGAAASDSDTESLDSRTEAEPELEPEMEAGKGVDVAAVMLESVHSARGQRLGVNELHSGLGLPKHPTYEEPDAERVGSDDGREPVCARTCGECGGSGGAEKGCAERLSECKEAVARRSCVQRAEEAAKIALVWHLASAASLTETKALTQQRDQAVAELERVKAEKDDTMKAQLYLNDSNERALLLQEQNSLASQLREAEAKVHSQERHLAQLEEVVSKCCNCVASPPALEPSLPPLLDAGQTSSGEGADVDASTALGCPAAEECQITNSFLVQQRNASEKRVVELLEEVRILTELLHSERSLCRSRSSSSTPELFEASSYWRYLGLGGMTRPNDVDIMHAVPDQEMRR